MPPVQKYRRTVRFLGALGVIGLTLLAASDSPNAARAQTKEARKASAKSDISPLPEDVNELSMEVTALRMLYLLKAGLLQLQRARRPSLTCAMKPRKRQKADVSPNYRTVLTELRAAFIAGQEDRINELSEQFEELAKEEDPDLDDGVEITQLARRQAHSLLSTFDAVTVVSYLGAYGKEFPDPRALMYQAMRLDGKAKKQTAEQWKETRAFVIREVSWMIGGIDLEKAKPQKIGERVGELLDQAHALSDEDLKKQKDKLAYQVNRLVYLPPTDIIKHVIEQDVAELLSNPRLRPAIDARLKYLARQAKKAAAE